MNEITVTTTAVEVFDMDQLKNIKPEPRKMSKEEIEAALNAALDKLNKIPGLVIEQVGEWLWISGNTKPMKEALKAAGCRWAPKRQKWVWHTGSYRKHTGRSKSWDELKETYGHRQLVGEAQ